MTLLQVLKKLIGKKIRFNSDLDLCNWHVHKLLAVEKDHIKVEINLGEDDNPSCVSIRLDALVWVTAVPDRIVPSA